MPALTLEIRTGHGVRVVTRWMSGVGTTDRGGGGREGELTSHDHTDHKASVRHVRTVRS